MLELEIDLLRLNVQGVSGQEHRLEGIAERALALLADQLAESSGGSLADPFGSVDPRGVRIDLDRMSDEQSARRLAEALRDAIRAQTGY